jgi:hypothetical protein
VKKVFSILLALALMLTMAVASAVPAAAVQAPIYVEIDNPIAKEAGDYTITFHNVGTLIADDWIDIMFPTGTVATYLDGNATIVKGAKKADVVSLGKQVTSADPVDVLDTQVISATSVRITLNDTVEKCDWVSIVVENITNPTSCDHQLEVGTSTHTPVDSELYTIYCARIELKGGVNPNTGLAMMNLISLPCYPADTSIESVLADLFLLKTLTAVSSKPFSFSVWYWDNESDTWLKYVSDSSFTDLETIEPGKAYWIKPSRDINFYIHGYPYPSGQGPPVKSCYTRSWNMVGFVCTEPKSTSVYLYYTMMPPAYTNSAVSSILGWNANTQSYVDLGWPYTAALLQPGAGYWMAFVDNACIIPPSDCDC